MSVVPFGAERVEADPLTQHHTSAAQPLPNSMPLNTPDDPTESQVRLGIYGDDDGRTLTGILEHHPGVDQNPLNPLREEANMSWLDWGMLVMGCVIATECLGFAAKRWAQSVKEGTARGGGCVEI